MRQVWADKTGCDTVSLHFTGKHIKGILREEFQNHIEQTESDFSSKTLCTFGKKQKKYLENSFSASKVSKLTNKALKDGPDCWLPEELEKYFVSFC